MKKLFLFFLIFNVITLSQENFTLLYKFEKGKTYYYEDVSSGKVVQEMMGQETRTDILSTNILKLKVDEVEEDGNIVLIASIDTITMKYTTKKEEKHEDLSYLLGKRKRITLSKIGEILKDETPSKREFRIFKNKINN